MASIPLFSVSLDDLYKNFFTVLTKTDMVLDDHLAPVPGNLLASQHNTILTLVLRVLDQTPLSSLPSEKSLESLGQVILHYWSKIESECNAAHRGNPIATDLANQVIAKIETLRSHAMGEERSKSRPPLSLVTLNLLFQIAALTPRCALDGNLRPVERTGSTPHPNTVLERILAILNDTEQDALPPQIHLTSLESTFLAYMKKVALLYGKGSRGAPINESIKAQIVQKIVSLQKLAQNKTSKSSPILTHACPPLLNAQEQVAITKKRLSYFLSEWYLFKSLNYTASLFTSHLHTREMLLSRGYHICCSRAGTGFLPPVSFFESPWPILILFNRFQKVMKVGVKEIDSYRNCFIKIKKAQKIYPQYKDVLDELFFEAEYAEYQQEFLKICPETLSTLEISGQLYQKSFFGPKAQTFIDSLLEIKDAFRQLSEKLPASYPTNLSPENTEFLAAERIEQENALLYTKIRDFMEQSVEEYKETLEASTEKYREALFEAKNLQLELRFTPYIPAPLFLKGKFFYEHISAELPSIEEFRQFSPIEFTSLARGCTQENESKRDLQRDLTRDERLEFLPKNLFSPPPPSKQKHRKRSKPHSSKPQAMAKESDPISPLTESMERLSIESKEIASPLSSKPKKEAKTENAPSPQPTCTEEKAPQKPSSPSRLEESTELYGFHIGEKANPNLQFAYRVRRWSDPTHDTFSDEDYKNRTFPPYIQESIRLQHTPPLALITVLLSRGERYLHKDKNKESFYLPAEATWNDGSGRYEKGVITLGRNQRTKEIFHYHFTQQAPSTLRENYASAQFYPYSEEEESAEINLEKADPRKRLPDDGSRITQISDAGIGIIGVTVEDSVRKISFDVYFET